MNMTYSRPDNHVNAVIWLTLKVDRLILMPSPATLTRRDLKMKYNLLLTRSCLHPRGLAITATRLLLLIFFALGAGINLAQAQTFAYIPNPCTGAVSVIDTATNTLVATIPIVLGPFEVAVASDGSRAYVSS